MDRLLYSTEEDLQSQQAPKCDLLVHIGLQTLQFAVFDNGHERIRSITEYTVPEKLSVSEILSAIKAIPEASREFRFPFNRIKIAIDSQRFTFIPKELYEESSIDDYVKFLRPASDDSILNNEIKAVGIRNIAISKTALIAGLKDIFYKPQLFNQATSFINGISGSGTNTGNLLFMDVSKNHIQVAGIRSGELLFYNLFETVNKEEVLYFTLGLSSQFELEPENLNLILSGHISEGDDLYSLLNKSFRDVRMADTSYLGQFPEVRPEFPSHRYFALLSLIRCG